MTIEEAIKKAIENGYNGYSEDYPLKDLKNWLVPSSLFLSPEFWKSLGKAMGWSMDLHNQDGHLCLKCDANSWIRWWHSFIDHLAAGKTIESFFENL